MQMLKFFDTQLRMHPASISFFAGTLCLGQVSGPLSSTRAAAAASLGDLPEGRAGRRAPGRARGRPARGGEGGGPGRADVLPARLRQLPAERLVRHQALQHTASHPFQASSTLISSHLQQ